MALKEVVLLSMGTPRMKARMTASHTALVGAPWCTLRQKPLPGRAPSRLKLKSILQGRVREVMALVPAACASLASHSSRQDLLRAQQHWCAWCVHPAPAAGAHLELAVTQAVPHSTEQISGMAMSHRAPAADWYRAMKALYTMPKTGLPDTLSVKPPTAS
jgi:hypothetical protein